MVINAIGTKGLAVGRAFVKTSSAKCRPQSSSYESVDLACSSAGEDAHESAILPAAASEAGLAAFRRAYSEARAELERLSESSEVFSAHLEMLEDPMLADTVEEFLAEGLTALESVRKASLRLCSMFSQIEDEYLRAREDDVRDVCERIARNLGGESFSWAELEPGSVVVAEELLPSDTAEMDLSKVSAFVTRRGSRTSHVCIIASNNSIPAVVGADISGISDGDVLLVDADRGEITVNPSGEQISDFESRMEEETCSSAAAWEMRFSPSITENGKHIPVYANAGNVDEISRAIAAGADGIGLFRTEFVFLDSRELPSEEQQYEIYLEAVKACEGKPLTVRTLDIGGDKALPYLPVPGEENPFLGLRGIRFCLAFPDIFRTQLRAILRASAYGRIRIMFPMIATVSELLQAKSFVEKSKAELSEEGLPYSPDIETGIMVETPSAVIMADKLASECSFFSIGTNDLTQYIMAADRGNPSVSYLYDPMSQPVVRAIAMTLDAAHRSGKPVAMCGELASDSKATELLIRLGLDVFSVAAPSVPSVKERIRQTNIESKR